MSSDPAADLTGVWQGLYVYRTGRHEGFTATVVQSGDFIGGATEEKSPSGRASAKMLYAILDGRRSGAQVTFTKTYDGTGGWTHSVSYQGNVSPDGGEIEGAWTVRPGYGGRFLMIRQGGKQVTVERRESVQTDA